MAEGEVDKEKSGVADITNTVKDALKPIQTLSEALGLMVAHGDKLNKGFGLKNINRL